MFPLCPPSLKTDVSEDEASITAIVLMALRLGQINTIFKLIIWDFGDGKGVKQYLRQRRDLFDLRVKLPPATISRTTRR